MNDQNPVHVALMVGAGSQRLVINGVDLTPHVRAFKIEAGPGALPDVWLDLIGVTVDIYAEVSRSRIQALTLEEAEAHEEARLTIDQQRGQRPYGRKGVTPSVQLAVSLGQGPRQEGT